MIGTSDGVGFGRFAVEVHVDPFMRAAVHMDIAAFRLPNGQSIGDKSLLEQRRHGRGDERLQPDRGHGKVDAEGVQQQGILPGGREDDRAGGQIAGRGAHSGDATAGRQHGENRGVLPELSAQVLKGPGEGLGGALRVGVAGARGVDAAQHPVGQRRDQGAASGSVYQVKGDVR
jgi:hypothetical protein